MEAAPQEGGGGEKICRKKNDGISWKCKNVSGDNKLQYCDKHYKDFIDFYTQNPSLISSNKSKFLPKKKMEEIELLKKNKLPLPDEHLCCVNTGCSTWRCKNLRMGHGDDHSVPKSTYCQKHYKYYASLSTKRRLLRKRNRDGAATDLIETRDSNCSKLRKNVIEEHDRSLAVTGIQPAAADIEGGSANVGTKRKKIQGMERSGELDFTDFLIGKPSLITSNEMKKKKEMEKMKLPPDEQRCSTAATGPVEETKGEKVTKEDDEAEIQLGATGDNTSDTIGRKMENFERAEKCGEAESLKGIGETVVELDSLEHYKSKCFELSVELEKKKLQYTTLQGKLAEVEATRKDAGTDESERTTADATECWRKMFSDYAGSMESRILDLEKIVLRMDNKISTMEGGVESRISKLESLVLKSGKGGSILKCVQLCHSEKIDSKAQGLQNDVAQSGEKLRDENDRKDSDVYECKTKEKVLNVYDAGSLRVSSEGENVEKRKDWGCSEERPSQHGSSSQDHLEISTEPFVNLVSDDESVEILGESEDSDCSTDSEHSLGTLMDMLAMKYRNKNQEKENKWKCEADMISSFEAEPDLCMKAVCALYQQQISEDEISDKGLLHNSDALRCTTLAKFLMDGDCKGNLNKSVKELGMLDSKAVDDCKRLAKGYSTQLFSIYQNGKDPFFLPGTTGASHGDETAK